MRSLNAQLLSSIIASSILLMLGSQAAGADLIVGKEGSFFRYGYGVTTPQITIQTAGADISGAGQGVLDVSQQVDLREGGPRTTVASVHSALSLNGGPATNFWAGGFLTYIQGLRDSDAGESQSQHGALYTHLVKTSAFVPSGLVHDGARLADGWAQWSVLEDRTGLPSSRGGALVGHEIDISGNGADDQVDKGRYARQVILSAYQKKGDTSPFEWGYGDYWNSRTGGVNDSFFNVVTAYYAGWTVAAIDLSKGTGARYNPYIDGVNRAVDIKMRDGGKLSFNGDGQNGSYLSHNSAALEWWSLGERTARLTDQGGLVLGRSNLTVSGGGIALSTVKGPHLAPGVGGGKLELVCGTRPGTARLVIFAGKSPTPVTLADNIGLEVDGC